jgi:rubrerythrin
MAKAKATGLRERAEVLPTKQAWCKAMELSHPESYREMLEAINAYEDGDPFWRLRFDSVGGLVAWCAGECGFNVANDTAGKWYSRHQARNA